MPHSLVPAVRDAGQSWIESDAEAGDHVGKRTSKVFELGVPEAAVRHHDPAAKPLVCFINRG